MNFTSGALVFHIILDSTNKKGKQFERRQDFVIEKVPESMHYGPEVIILHMDVFCLAHMVV